MASSINLTTFISSILGITTIVLGVDISRKVSGKLKTLLIFVIATTAIFAIDQTIKILNALEILNLKYSESMATILLAIFFFATMIIIKSVIEQLGRLNGREKRK